jgi:integrase
MGLGAAGGGGGKVSLALARRKRDQAMEQIGDGLDPVRERRKAKDARAARKTFGETAALVIAARKSGWRANVDGRNSSLDEWTKHLTGDCAPISKKPVDEIDVNDVKRIVQPYWDDGVHAVSRRLLKRIETTLAYATAHGYRQGDNPASWTIFRHLAPSLPKNGDKQHHPAMDWREVPAFMVQLRNVRSMSSLALEFAVLCAVRSGEARGALWSEIDLAAAGGPVWRIGGERMKSARQHDVPLSRQAVDLLHRMEGLDKRLVFPGENKGEAVHNTTLWQLVKRLAPGASTHGFRSSFRDWCGEHGVERELAELCLAHAIGNATEQAYNRTQLIERRRPVMQAWADHLDGETAAGKVVPLKRA